jgi:hypothetical protein
MHSNAGLNRQFAAVAVNSTAGILFLKESFDTIPT